MSTYVECPIIVHFLYVLVPVTRTNCPLVLAIYLRERAGELDEIYQFLLIWLPYVTLGVCLCLSGYYSRSRLFTISLALLAAYYLIQQELQVSLSEPRALLIYSLISFMLPLTFFLLLFLPERGLRNRYGFLLVAMMGLQLCLGFWLLYYVSDALLLGFVNGWMPIKLYSGYVLSLSASAFFVVVCILGLWCMYHRDANHATAILTALIFSFTTLAFFDLASISVTMFAMAGLGLTVGLIGSSYDMAYRYGGEEFSVVFSSRDIEYCEPFLEAVRLSVEKYRMTLGDSEQRPESDKEAKTRRGRRSRKRGEKTVSVTISIGMATRNAQHQSAEEVWKAADTALYKAKKNGRNCLAY